MTGDNSTPEPLRQELRDLDAQIAQLKGQSADVKGQVGAYSEGVQDSEEIAAGLTNVEEQEAVIGILERRREAIVEKLKQLGS
jgi:hypothetical protein